MKISTEIDGKNYTFEFTRTTYKNLLLDQEYSKIQDDLLNKNEKKIDNLDSSILLQNLIIVEKIFYYSLLKNHPDMTSVSACDLMDKMIEEDGSMDGVAEMTQELVNSFTLGTAKNKKKRVLVKS